MEGQSPAWVQYTDEVRRLFAISLTIESSGPWRLLSRSFSRFVRDWRLDRSEWYAKPDAPNESRLNLY